MRSFSHVIYHSELESREKFARLQLRLRPARCTTAPIPGKMVKVLHRIPGAYRHIRYFTVLKQQYERESVFHVYHMHWVVKLIIVVPKFYSVKIWLVQPAFNNRDNLMGQLCSTSIQHRALTCIPWGIL